MTSLIRSRPIANTKKMPNISRSDIADMICVKPKKQWCLKSSVLISDWYQYWLILMAEISVLHLKWKCNIGAALVLVMILAWSMFICSYLLLHWQLERQWEVNVWMPLVIVIKASFFLLSAPLTARVWITLPSPEMQRLVTRFSACCCVSLQDGRDPGGERKRRETPSLHRHHRHPAVVQVSVAALQWSPACCVAASIHQFKPGSVSAG